MAGLCLALPVQTGWALDPNALPTGGTVVGGSAAIGSTTAGRLDILQSSQRTAIDWLTFNIGSAAQVNFAQPNASAVALNRVLSSSASEIAGRITANGQVFLVNPAGVLFSRTAQVNVGGLVASTLDISSADFMAGRATFANSGGAGSVVNQGALTANPGGYIALLAPEVRNEGLITATLGAAALGAGDRVTLDFAGDRLLSLRVDVSAVNAAIVNRHLIAADGGQVIMSARAAGDLSASVVNNEGIIQARSLVEVNGVIRLEGAQTVSNSGTIDASGQGAAAGGSVSISAGNVVNSGRIAANAEAASAGAVYITAGGSIVQGEGGSIEAKSSAGGSGGNIVLQGGYGSAGEGVALSGAVTATGGTGGSIRILGGALTLSGAQVDASGTNAGGTILVGGGYHGGDASSRNADTVSIDSASTLDVSATGQGNAGRAIVWSDRDTRFAGTVLARGGAQGGDGGFVEVSSGEHLGFGGYVNAGAPYGSAGTLLLDPKNIDVNDTLGLPYLDGTNNQFANDPTGTSVILATGVGSISAQTANVLLQANNDITFSSPVNITNAGTTLTAQAGRSILVNANITTKNGDITLSANDPAAQLANRDAGAGGIAMATGTTLDAGNGNVALTVGTLSTSGNITLFGVNGTVMNITNSGATAGSGIVFGGNVTSQSLTATATSGGITINGGVTVAASGAGNIVLAGTSFTNNAGAGALSVAGGRWLVYSANPAGDNRGGLVYAFKQYNATFGVTAPAQGTGNGFLYTVAPLITPSLTGTTSKTYDGTTTASLVPANYATSGAIDGDTVVLNNPASGTYIDKNAGAGKSVSTTVAIASASNGAAVVYGYQLSSTTASGNIGTIGVKPVNLAGTRVYDATGNFTFGSFTPTITGTVGVETLTIASGTGTVPSANVSAGTQTLTIGSLTLGNGTGLASNYTLVGGTNTGTVTTKTVNLAGTRIYDATANFTAASFTPTITGTVGGETLTIVSGTGTVPSANVSAGTQTLTVGTLALGNGTGQASNYTLVGGTNTGTVTAKTVNFAATRVYDGTANFTAASFTPTITGTVGGETLTIASGTGTVPSANVSAGTQTLTVGTLALGSGTGLASNYTLVGGTNTGTITVKTVTLSGTRAYDATTNFTAGAFTATITGTVGGETLTIASGTGTVPSANVAAGQTLALGTLTLGNGTGQASNYTLSASGNTGLITAKPVNLAGTRVYDGTANFVTGSFTPTITGTVGGQTLTIASGTGTVPSANVSAGTQTLTIGSLTLGSGTGLASNYTLVGGTNAGTVTTKIVNLSSTRVYDGTANFVTGSFTPTITGTVGGETLTIASGTGTVPSANVSAGTQTLTVGTLALGSGTGLASNYTLVGGTNTGTITVKTVTLSGTRAYDATTNFTAGAFTATITGTVGGETLTIASGTGTVPSANVAAGQTLTTGTLALGNGTGLASNYAFAASGHTGTITSGAIIVNLAATRAYDGTATFTAGSFSFTITGTVGGETLTIASGTGTVPSANVSAGTQTLTLDTLTLGNGTGLASNYTLVGGTNTGTITAKTVTLAGTRAYDGTANFTGAFTATFAGTIGGQTLTIASGTGTVPSANVSAGTQTLTIGSLTLGNGTGLASNYTLSASGNTGAITAKSVNLAGTRVYDATANFVTGSFTPTITGTVGGETLTIASGTGTVPSANVSAGTQTLTVGTLALGSGTGLASNYTLVGGTNTGTITTKTVNLSGTRVYDGTANFITGSFTPTITGTVGGETLTIASGTGTVPLTGVAAGTQTLTAGTLTLGNGTGLATNYTLVGGTNTGTITAKTVNLAASRVYDASANFVTGSFTPTITGTVGGETLTIASGTGTVPSANVAAGQTLTLGTLTLGSGTGLASNYTLVGGTNTGTVTAKPVNLAGTRVYDGTANFAAGSFTPTITGTVGTDTLTIAGGTGTVPSANVAAGQALTTGTLALGNGTGLASNYTLVGGTNTGSITVKTVTLSGTRAYDATTNFTAGAFTATITGTTGGETLTVASGTGTVPSANVAAGQTLTIGSLTLGSGTGLASNYTLAASGNTGTVTAKPVNLAATRAYDATQNFTAAAFTATITGTAGPETLIIASGTGFVPSANVSAGTQTLTVGTLALGNGTGLATNYTLVGGTNTGTVTAKPVNLTGTRVYDGTANFVSGAFTATITGTVGGQTLTIASGTGTVPLTGVAAGAQTLTTGTLTLGDGTGTATNYTLVGGTHTGAINPKIVNLAAQRVFDTFTTFDAVAITPHASISASITGTVAGETLTLASGSGTVPNANTGTYTLTIGTLTLGNGTGLASNYTLVGGTHTGTISPAGVVVNLIANRPYDSTANFTAGSFSFTITGTLNGETLTIASGTGNVPSANVSAGTQVLSIGTLTLGNGTGQASNYTLVGGSSTGTITPKTVALAGTRQYDGTLNFVAGSFTPTITGTAGGQTLTIASGTGTVPSANVAASQTLTVGTLTLGNGTGVASNYTLVGGTNTGTVTAKPVNLAATRVYDASANFVAGAFTATITGMVGAETLTIASGTGTVPSKNVGTQTLTVGTLTLGSGTGLASNYMLVGGTNTATITQRPITVTATINTKTYDGTASAATLPTVTLGSLVDTATLAETYSDKNAGTGKTLIPTATINDGNGGANYAVAFVSNITGVINPRAITVTAQTNSKIYDGNTGASAPPTITGTIASGDTPAFTEAYSNKNAGTGKTLVPTGSVSDGNGGANYAVAFANNTTGVIGARAITVTAQTDTKVYDGTTSSVSTGLITTGSLATGDTALFAETFSNKDAGILKTLTASGAVSDGNFGLNYTVSFQPVATGTITAAPLIVRANDVMRLVNTSNPPFTATVSGLVNGETLASLNGTLVVSTTATATSPVNMYPIHPSLTLPGIPGANYTITLVDGILTIVSAIGTDPTYNSVGSVAQGVLVGGYAGGAEDGPFAVRRSRRSDAAPDGSAAPIEYGDWVSLTIRNGGMRLPSGVI